MEYLNYLAVIITDNARFSLHVKLNPAFQWQKQHSTRKGLYSLFKEETMKVLHLEHSFLRCRNLGTMEESISEIP